jgi:hypothetical protein
MKNEKIYFIIWFIDDFHNIISSTGTRYNMDKDVWRKLFRLGVAG